MIKRSLLLVTVLAALAAAVLFARPTVRTFELLQTAYGTGVTQTSSLRGWMTIDYVADAYALPKADLIGALGLPADIDTTRSFGQIALENQQDPFELVKEVQRVIAELTPAELGEPSELEEEAGWFDRIEEQFLQAVIVYGYPALGLILLLGSFGLPVPTGLATTIAGAAASREGLDWAVAVSLAVGASVVGDVLAYLVGGAISPDFVLRHGRWIGYSAANRTRIENLFHNWGAATVLVTRTLVSHLSSVASLLAGFHRYSLPGFVAYSAAGRIIWTAAYFGLGYAVGTDFEAASGFLRSLGITLFALVVAAVAGFFLVRDVTAAKAPARASEK